MGQEGFGAHSKAKQVSQIMQKKFLSHKNSQNTPILSVSYLSDCTYANKSDYLQQRINFDIQ